MASNCGPWPTPSPALAVRWFTLFCLFKVGKLLEAKKRYKDTTGTDYAPPKPDKKKDGSKKSKPNVSKLLLSTSAWSRYETSWAGVVKRTDCCICPSLDSLLITVER